MDIEKISIVSINLNNRSGLINTFDSIASQTEKPFEWVVVDGASNDGSIAFLQSLNLNNDLGFAFRYISEKDSGIYDAMNRGVGFARGDFILFLNSGDTLYNERAVSTLCGSLNKSKADLLLGGFVYKSKLFRPKPIWWRFISLPTSHQSMVYKKNIFAFDCFDEKLKIAGDFEHFLRIIKRQKLKIIHCNSIISMNEVYGSERDMSAVEREYSLVLSKYLPVVLAYFLTKMKFASVRFRLFMNKYRYA